MRWISKLRLRLRSLFFRNRMEQELDEELRYHLEREMEEGALGSTAGIEQRKEECSATDQPCGYTGGFALRSRHVRRGRFVQATLSNLSTRLGLSCTRNLLRSFAGVV